MRPYENKKTSDLVLMLEQVSFELTQRDGAFTQIQGEQVRSIVHASKALSLAVNG